VIEFAPSESEYLEMPIEEKSTFIAEFTSEVTSKLPIIDDAVVTLISSKTFDDLYTAQGKENLRLELSNLITQRLPDYRILSVYLTEFVVQ